MKLLQARIDMFVLNLVLEFNLFGGFSGFQHMEKMGPGNNCWTLSKVVDKISTAWPEKTFQF